jgi:hypothetical protein
MSSSSSDLPTLDDVAGVDPANRRTGRAKAWKQRLNSRQDLRIQGVAQVFAG